MMSLPGQVGVAGVSATPKKMPQVSTDGFISQYISPSYRVGSPENNVTVLPGQDVGAKS